MGTLYAITDTHTINIYWLLLVLLGFNFISMLLWLIGISLNMPGLSAGLLARLTGWLPGVFEHRVTGSTQDATGFCAFADRAYLHCVFTGAVGKWQFSKITHQLWLTYLLAGLICLVMLLMVRQYDFIWGTTLLSDAAFIQITEVLSRPLELIGFNTPSAVQVQQSRLGAGHLLNAEHRTGWAQFLLGSLLCFGIVPRVVLLAWSTLMSIRARRLFKLDLYLPYYISLRQRLMPLASHGQIVDADTAPPEFSTGAPAVATSHPLPEHTKWVAVEPGNNLSWPIASINPQDNLGQVVDRESLSSTIQLIKGSSHSVVAVAVAASRSPDRGIQRTVCSLLTNVNQRWLVLLQLPGESEVSANRLGAWYRLAEACNIPADHVINLSVDER